MAFTIALTRLPSQRMHACNLTYMQRGAINIDLAKQQHDNYCQHLVKLGCQVETLPADDSLPDCAFVEDVAVVLDEIAIIGQPHDSRQPEIELSSEYLKKHRHIEPIEPNGKLEGGDVLRVGRRLFVGLSSRTDLDGIEQFRNLVDPFGYQVVTVPVTGCLHLKTACTALDQNTFLINEDWIDASVIRQFGELVEIPKSEPFAANTLRVGNSILVSNSTPQTAELLSKTCNIVTVDISEFSKAEAGLTCLSLIFSLLD